jgi:uncharacterized protein YjbJ (UPF0337 family)
MNWEGIEGNWNDFQGKLIQQWSKLTSDDVNQVRGRRDALLGKLQERYGISRQLAENQIEDWMRRVGEHSSAGMEATDSISQVYQRWFGGILDAQRQSVELMSGQMRKAMELPARLTECRNPVDVARIQADFAQSMMSDYFEGARKMLSVLTDSTEHLARDQNEAVRQQVQQLKAPSSR